jgi:hypothetical protein
LMCYAFAVAFIIFIYDYVVLAASFWWEQHAEVWDYAQWLDWLEENQLKY